jgi:hypothetical protein
MASAAIAALRHGWMRDRSPVEEIRFMKYRPLSILPLTRFKVV